MHKDSAFAVGTGIKFLKFPEETKEIRDNRKCIETMRYFNESELLTTTAAAILLNTSRMVAQKLLSKLWKAHLIKCVEVVTNSVPERVFKIWASTDKMLPKSPNEACRLAALSAFYGRAKNNLPGFVWDIKRRNKAKKIYAYMTYLQPGEKKKSTLLIDAPRRGEEPNPEADIIIFPTLEEAKTLTPAGKRYTTDYILLNRAIPFENLISDPVKNTI